MLIKDIEDNKAIGKFGSEAVLKSFGGDGHVRVLTHCNTGSLATAGYGTALGVIRSLHAAKRLGKIYITVNCYVYVYTEYSTSVLIASKKH